MFPITGAGLSIIGLTWLAYVFWAKDAEDFVAKYGVYLLWIIMLIDVVNIIFFSIVLRFRLKKRYFSNFLSLEGESNNILPTNIKVPRIWWWPLMDFSWDWVDNPYAKVDIKQGFRFLEERVKFHRRGSYSTVKRRIVIRDPFGFSRIAFHIKQDANIRVVPRDMNLQVLPSLFEDSGEGYSHPQGQPVGDWVDLRRYVWGDPLRMIVWKAFARTRKLMVRQQERSILPDRTIGLYLAPDRADEPAASIINSLIQHILARETFFFMSEPAGVVAKNQKDTMELLLESARFDQPTPQGIEAFMEKAKKEGSSYLVFVMSKNIPELVINTVAAATKEGINVMVFIGINPDFPIQDKEIHKIVSLLRKQKKETLYERVNRLKKYTRSVYLVEYPDGKVSLG